MAMLSAPDETSGTNIRYGLREITYGWARACRIRVGPRESNEGDIRGVMLMARTTPTLPWSSDRYEGIRLVQGGSPAFFRPGLDHVVASVTITEEELAASGRVSKNTEPNPAPAACLKSHRRHRSAL